MPQRTDGKHVHPCRNPKGCTAIWEHGNDCAEMGEEFFKKAHTCPVCGFMEDDPIGYHGTAMKANIDHPVQCPVGKRPPAPPFLELLEQLFAA